MKFPGSKLWGVLAFLSIAVLIGGVVVLAALVTLFLMSGVVTVQVVFDLRLPLPIIAACVGGVALGVFTVLTIQAYRNKKRGLSSS